MPDYSQFWIDLNNQFYNIIAKDFDGSRQYYWSGWGKIYKYLTTENKSLKVLDLGTGNGRLAEFLEEETDFEINFTGIDSNQFLLKKARSKLPTQTWIKADIMQEPQINELVSKFDLITIFGVMHHLPDPGLRKNLLQKCQNLLTKNGRLIFTTWLFLDEKRLKKKLLTSTEVTKIFKLKQKLAKNDYIMDWKRGQKAYRYCHYYTVQEVQKLCKETNLEIIDTFLDDGKTRNINQYFICRKVETIDL